MTTFCDKLRPILASLRSAPPDKKRLFEIMPFWIIFEEWMNARPNSPEELSCIERIKKKSI